MGFALKKTDKGKTFLLFKKLVDKDDPRIEVLGILDELCAFLSFAKNLLKNNKERKIIERIQMDLFLVGTEVAASPRFIRRIEKRLEPNHIEYLEEHIRKVKSKNNPKDFCVSAQNTYSSVLDICRTITRKLERRAVSLKKKRLLKNPYVLAYLNRLSGLLYIWARNYEIIRR